MQNPQQNLGKTREELAQILREFTQLQKRIEAVRDSMSDSLVRLFGEERPAFAGLEEEAFIERIASGVVSRLPAPPKRQRFSTTKLEGQEAARRASGHATRHDGEVFREGVEAVYGTANR